jgi:hypothetical protein
MVESWQRNQPRKGFTGTSSSSQLLTDADTITGTLRPIFCSKDRGSQLSLLLVGEVIIEFLGICGGYYSISE